MPPAPHPNYLREALSTRRFMVTIELTTPRATLPLDEAIRPLLSFAREIRDDPRIDALAVTDRSRSDNDHSPVLTAARVAEASGKTPLVHWAGKDRSLHDLEADLERAESHGLDTFLLVTGDKVRHPPKDRRVQYLDSANALDAARQRSSRFLLAGAVSPFKYREEELLNQYLKAGKKLRAGANFLMTQIGWDFRKFAEVRWFLAQRGFDAPLIAELLLLTPARSRRIRRLGLPGVTITAQFAQRLQEDAARPDGGEGVAFRRLALQIAILRDQGYAGVQVSGLTRYPHVLRLFDETEMVGRTYPTPESRRAGWRELLMLNDGRTAEVAPPDGLNLQESAENAVATTVEWARYRTMDMIDRTVFEDSSTGARTLGALLRRVGPRSFVDETLRLAERAIKGPLLGCQTCGFCRLPATAYVCPETCPKGLANGPCGGTKDNICEFGDRECIHNRIYRVSKQAGMLSNLEEVLIPPVPEAAWDRCSWVTHFRGEGPKVRRLR